jgi:activator of HSP90 ATPase
MAETVQFSVDLPVSTERVYRAWLDGYEHGRFTGSPASVDGRVGGKYTAFDGTISGETLVMTPYNRIVQTWRTSDLAPGSPDMQIELKLEPTCLGAQLTLIHSGIPDGKSAEYLQNWEQRYFRPLLDYFEELVGSGVVDMDG